MAAIFPSICACVKRRGYHDDRVASAARDMSYARVSLGPRHNYAELTGREGFTCAILLPRDVSPYFTPEGERLSRRHRWPASAYTHYDARGNDDDAAISARGDARLPGEARARQRLGGGHFPGFPALGCARSSALDRLAAIRGRARAAEAYL